MCIKYVLPDSERKLYIDSTPPFWFGKVITKPVEFELTCKGCEFLSNPFERVCVMHPHSIQSQLADTRPNCSSYFCAAP